VTTDRETTTVTKHPYYNMITTKMFAVI